MLTRFQPALEASTCGSPDRGRVTRYRSPNQLRRLHLRDTALEVSATSRHHASLLATSFASVDTRNSK